MIVKIQRPLMTNEANPQALVYTKDRIVDFTIDASKVDKAFGPGEYKVYHNASLSSKGVLHVGSRVADQDW